MRYHTFDLTVSATGMPHEYLLSAQTSQHGETHAPIKTKIDVSTTPVADLLEQLANNEISLTDLQTLGKVLYESLVFEEINLLLNRALGETLGRDDLGLRLRLRLNPPELAALPWEFLYSPERHLFLAASVETPLSRYLNLPEPVRQLTCPAQINLLAVVTKNSGLDTSDEQLALKEVATKLGGKINLNFLEGEATSIALRAALRKKAYHIFHYAGHGSFENNEAFIHLDHAENMTAPMSADHFAQFFVDYPSLRFVFLNACQGAARSAREALVGVAPQLVLRGVPAVVAMQYEINNDDAILFATEFYEELCHPRDGGQIEVAISRARKALLQEKPNSPAFGNPALYLRAEDGRLWEAKESVALEVKPKVVEKKPLFERWQAWVAFLSALVVLIGAITDLPPKLLQVYKTVAGVAEKCQFSGTVVDVAGNAVAGAEVIIVGETNKDTTDANGLFSFEAKRKAGETVEVMVIKDGVKGYNGLETLPGPVTLTFTR